jgi:hypothetical protein
MNAEEAIRYELNTISGLYKKVFPLIAKDTLPPYLVYEMLDKERVQGLNAQGLITTADYDLVFYHTTYSLLKALSDLIVAKIESFPLRVIGTAGPYIQQVEITDHSELYLDAIPMYAGTITFTIHY